MPLPDPRFVPCFPLQGYFVDKDTGTPLSAGVITFYEDENPTVLKPIYQQSQSPSGSFTYTQLNNPMTLTSVGTWADNNGDDIIPFLYPFSGLPTDNVQGDTELYYITVYAAAPPVGSGALQFTREGWPPGVISSVNPTSSFSTTENELANPQFVTVNFQPDPATSSYTFNVSGSNIVNNIAPDWSIITNGTGTVTVTQVPITDTNVPSNPPYVLDINSSGITSLVLYQQLKHSPRLFANGFISGSFVAATVGSSITYPLTLQYAPSMSGASTIILASGNTTPDGLYTTINGTAQITGVISTDPATTGYVNIVLSIPVAAHIRVSSFQICGVDNLESSVEFLQQSTARQLDHLWHYYQNQIIMQPKNSILTGWNFPLNPAQFGNTGTIASSSYTWDQTIVSVQNGSTLTFQPIYTDYFSLQAIPSSSQGKWALIQYIDPSTVLPYWEDILSSLVQTGIISSNNTSIHYKMRLIVSSTTPSTVDPIASWGAIDPVFTSQWTALTPINDPVYSISSSIIGSTNNITFEGFQMPFGPSLTATVGIVLYTTNILSSVGSGDLAYFSRISLVPNRFAVDSPPQTTDQVWRECQFYYEKSYPIRSLAGSASTGGALVAEQAINSTGGTANFLLPRVFGFPFKNIKRTTFPTVNLYAATSGTLNAVTGIISNGGAVIGTGDIATTNWTATTLSSTAIQYYANTVSHLLLANATPNFIEGFISYHYVIDARLGLVA